MSKKSRARLIPLSPSPGNLPARPTSFIGRERELEEVQRLFAATRLLTLSGVGGVGKTRLALEMAAGLLSSFPDGVCFVDLAPLADPGLVVTTLAQAVGLRDAGSRPLAKRLEVYLRPRTLLLVLDNCEHVVEACARLAESLLRVCPDLRILATSRQPFRIQGEMAWRVPSLTLPEAAAGTSLDVVMRSESGRLFLERARAARPDFAVTDAGNRAIATICRRLDGIPLALELAAARIAALSVDEIARRLSDRFRFLIRGSPAALPRHQTLRGMIDWSYEWLSEAEQTLFRRLSVFPGEFELEAAEAICEGGRIARDDVCDLLARLVDQSLVVPEERDGELRYRVLETIRQYGAERLREAGEETDVRRRHRDVFLALAERADREQHGPECALWFARLEREIDNLRLALDWCRTESGAAETGLGMADALFRFWETRGHLHEGQDWLAQFLLRAGADAGVVRARALGSASYLTLWLGDHAAAAAFGEEGLALARAGGDQLCHARVARQYGFVLLWTGKLERAAALLEESLRAARETGDRSLASMALANLGEVARQRREYDRAEALLSEALALAREQQDPWCVAVHFSVLGRVAWSRGQHEPAAGFMRESLKLLWAMEHRRVISVQLEGLGWVATAGHPSRAAYLLAAAEAVRESIGITLVPGQRAEHDRAVSESRTRLGDAAFQAAWAAGLTRPIGVTIKYALSTEARLPPSTAFLQPHSYPTGSGEEAGLTLREREVVALIARGDTNNQIARKLLIARRTAETHIEHILGKLGFHSRAQVVAWAVRRGLDRDT